MKTIDLKAIWKKSHSQIPKDKSVSNYAIFREKDFPRNSLVCDLGGGTGADAIYFLEQGHVVTLLDISEYAIEIASQKAHDLGLNLKTGTVSLGEENLPLTDNSVDIVYSRLTVHYFDQKTTTRIFKDIYRLLKPGGKAYLTLKSPDDEKEMAFLNQLTTKKESGVFEEADGQFKSRFTLSQLESITSSAGISKFKIHPYIENLGNRVDTVKSGNKELLLSEVILEK